MFVPENKVILEQVRYATVSTVDAAGKPWAAPVWYVFDGERSPYWWSPTQSKHSENISRSREAYITIFDTGQPEGEGDGLYLHAHVEEVHQGALRAALDRYNESFQSFHVSYEACIDPAPTRLYKATVHESWRNKGVTEDGHYVDVRIKVEL